MASNFSRPAMSLKEFMLRKQVLQLYRDILRAIKEIPSPEDRKYMKDWAKSDFLANKHHTDEMTIKMMIKHGERSLKELRQSLEMSRG
ncbi:unnamed protein product [Nesidiocoris tenuis]|uniref:LYR motif-containing protein 2 n=2 Tax=Nesidiocoris tenuis TaxID=355587 RepID=A0A6H5FY46_9HEMI|nr:Complex 1 protein (LYR family) [Nesidiocoris tenuis]CAA9994496.1 unnamed protein product [Nesidiocoris tenuis]